MQRGQTALGLLVLVALLAIVVAACGSSSSSSSGASGSGSSGSGASASNASSSKQPVKVMMITTLSGAIAFPETVTGATAAEKAINAAGGINGHPLDIIVCDNKYSENLDAQCGQQAVSDGVVAMVGGFSLLNGHFPITDAAKIPDIGGYQSAPQAYTSPFVYPLNGYSVSAETGEAAACADLFGAKKLVQIAAAIAGANAFTPAIDKTLSYRDGSFLGLVQMTPGTPDPSPYLEKALSYHPQGIMLTVSAPDNDKITKLMSQVAPNVYICRSSTSVSSDTVATLGSALNKAVIASQFLPTTATNVPGVRQWLSEMKADSSKPVFDDFSANSWAAVHVFAEIVKPLTSITKESIVSQLAKGLSYPSLISGPVTWKAPLPSSVTGIPAALTRVFNVQLTYNKVVHGQITNVVKDKFFSPFEPPPSGS